MKMHKKIILGIGFLFVIIFSLTFFCSYYIEKLDDVSKNILKDNNKSIAYTKNMLDALDDINHILILSNFQMVNSNYDKNEVKKNISIYQSKLEKNLTAEENNITEFKEKEFVDSLKRNYNILADVISNISFTRILNDKELENFLIKYDDLKKSINNIYYVNWKAIIRKNDAAAKIADEYQRNMVIISVCFIILAFGYFWYFPFYISNSLSFLVSKINELLKKLNIHSDINSDDELEIILKSVELLEINYNKVIQ
ncbi:MAG: hypothetical protein HZB41_07020 [Ignavibacteriae bacterium]|nr:hypothetical protein [Ignavibacteriota bacterium]